MQLFCKKKGAPNFKIFCPYATGKKKREKIQERKKKKKRGRVRVGEKIKLLDIIMMMNQMIGSW